MDWNCASENLGAVVFLFNGSNYFGSGRLALYMAIPTFFFRKTVEPGFLIFAHRSQKMPDRSALQRALEAFVSAIRVEFLIVK